MIAKDSPWGTVLPGGSRPEMVPCSIKQSARSSQSTTDHPTALIKNKSQEFVPRAVRASLGHFEKPRPPAGSSYLNKRQHLLRLVDRSEHGHSWQVSSPHRAANLQLTCATCRLWVQQTYSQADFHRVVTHPCVGFSNEGPTYWPLLHSTHVMRSTSKAWACLGCKQVVGVTSKTLKTALQLPCRSVGRQSSLSFRAPHVSSPPLPTQACGPPPAPPEMAQASRSSQPRLAFAAQHGRVSDAPVSV